MGWIYDIEYTKDKEPIIVKIGIKDPKEVPGALVHWIDTRGDIHHEYVPIYVKGPLKDKPKSTVHGCLDKNREPILRIDKDRAQLLITDYNYAIKKYKTKPTENGFPSLEGKSDKEKKVIYAEMRKKANEFAVKNAKYEMKRAEELRIQRIENVNRQIAKDAEELINTPNSGIYIDKNGHMRMGILDVKMSDAMKKKMKKRRNKEGAKFRAYNFQKLNDQKRASPSIRKASKKYLAELEADIENEKKNEEKNRLKAEKRAKKAAKKLEAEKKAREEAEKKAKIEASGGYISKKSWDVMTDTEKLNHAKRVIEIENNGMAFAIKAMAKNNPKLYLQRYEELSDEVKNRHLP